jgi:hypothetical protein
MSSHLRPERNQFISNRRERDRILDVFIHNLKRSPFGDIVIYRPRAVSNGFLRDIACAHGIQVLVPRQWNRVGRGKAIAVAPDSRVDSYTEDVLVRRRHDTVCNASAPWHFGIRVDRLCREDSGRAGLECDFTGLVEIPHENILVVGSRDDVLQHKLAFAHHRGISGAVVCMLPLNSVVDFVDARHIRLGYGASVVRDDVAVVIFDRAKAVAAN